MCKFMVVGTRPGGGKFPYHYKSKHIFNKEQAELALLQAKSYRFTGHSYQIVPLSREAPEALRLPTDYVPTPNNEFTTLYSVVLNRAGEQGYDFYRLLPNGHTLTPDRKSAHHERRAAAWDYPEVRYRVVRWKIRTATLSAHTN